MELSDQRDYHKEVMATVKDENSDQDSQDDIEAKHLEYDPHKLPADIRLARLHYKCSRFGRPPDLDQKEEVVLCPCCNQTRQQMLPMWLSCSKLDSCGPVLPMLFQFAKYLAILGLGYAAAGIYLQSKMISIHCTKENNKDPNRSCPSNMNDFFPNFYNEYSTFMTPVFACLALYTVLVLVVLYCRQSKLMISIDRRKPVTVAPYTIMVKDLDSDEMRREYLLSVLTADNPGIDINIEKVSFATLLGAKMEAQQELQEEEEHLKKLRERVRLCEDPETKKGLESVLLREEKHVKKLASSKILQQPNSKENSVAFVTLKTKEQAANVKKTKALNYYLNHWMPCCYKKKVHWVEMAPEPEDVYWYSVGVSFRQRVINKLVRYVITILSMVVLAAIYLLCTWLEYTLEICKSKGMLWAKILFYKMWVTPVAVVIVNKLLIGVATLMIDRETHITENMRLLSLGIRYADLQLWNTLLGVLAESYQSQ